MRTETTIQWPADPEHRRLIEKANLTAKQLTVLRLRASGMGYRPISRALGISPAAVRDHCDAALRKLAATGEETEWLPSP